MQRIRPTKVTPKGLDELVAQFGLSVANLPNAAGQSLGSAQVTGIASDNRTVTPGEVFAALPGGHVHGAQFAADAVARGAVAVLTDAAGAELLAATQPAVPVLISADLRATLGPIANWIYGQPHRQLVTFAVTGTNGKTTTAYLVNQLLTALGSKSGLIGTIEMRSGNHVLPSSLTTPDAADLQALLATMAEDAVTTLIMEVSSHALSLHRVDGVQYSVAGFTNLSQDHLDFHKTMAEYFAAKALLFTPEHAERGVVLVDDNWGRQLTQVATIPVTTIKTVFGDYDAAARAGLDGESDYLPDVDWVVSDVRAHGTGSAFTLTSSEGEVIDTFTPLPGSFNVQNAALAVVMVLASGVSVADMQAALVANGGVAAVVPGRMEVITLGDGATPRVIVDFAHNTEALREALASLQHDAAARDTQITAGQADSSTPGKLIVLFGAAGERDQDKRPKMGAAAVEGADVVYLTDDDPHEEDPAQIRQAVRIGAEAAVAAQLGAGRQVELIEIADRAQAIRAAILAAQPGDTVLLAGRGHETSQPVGHGSVPLDDRVEARAALAARPNSSHHSAPGAQGAADAESPVAFGAVPLRHSAPGAQGAADAESQSSQNL